MEVGEQPCGLGWAAALGKPPTVSPLPFPGHLSEDPRFPKVPWPTPDLCPACHEETRGVDSWNEGQVLLFLKRHYSSSNLVHTHAATLGGEGEAEGQGPGHGDPGGPEPAGPPRAAPHAWPVREGAPGSGRGRRPPGGRGGCALPGDGLLQPGHEPLRPAVRGLLPVPDAPVLLLPRAGQALEGAAPPPSSVVHGAGRLWTRGAGASDGRWQTASVLSLFWAQTRAGCPSCGALAHPEFTGLHVCLSCQALFGTGRKPRPLLPGRQGPPEAAAEPRGQVLGCGSATAWWGGLGVEGWVVARLLPQGQCLCPSLCCSGDERAH